MTITLPFTEHSLSALHTISHLILTIIYEAGVVIPILKRDKLRTENSESEAG